MTQNGQKEGDAPRRLVLISVYWPEFNQPRQKRRSGSSTGIVRTGWTWDSPLRLDFWYVLALV